MIQISVTIPQWVVIAYVTFLFVMSASVGYGGYKLAKALQGQGFLPR